MTAPSASLLGSGQIAKRVFDEDNGAVRVIQSAATDFAISLSAAENDSVLVVSQQSQQTADITNASTGVIIPAFSVAGLTKIALYTNTTSTITGEQVCTLQVSPSDTDNVWLDTAATITPDTTNGVSVYTAPVTVSARRARVSIATNITTGTFKIYVIASQ